jgi:hypothetical protein
MIVTTPEMGIASINQRTKSCVRTGTDVKLHQRHFTTNEDSGVNLHSPPPNSSALELLSFVHDDFRGETRMSV